MTEINNSESRLPEKEINFKQLILKIKEYLFFLKFKWVIIVIAGIFGAAVGFTYAFFQKPTYTATMSFVLEDDKGGGGLSGAMGLASSLGIDLGSSAGGAFSGANLIELMKSRTLIERVLLNPINVKGKTKSLAEYYLEFSKIRESLSHNSQLSEIHYAINESREKFTIQKDSLLGEIYKRVIGENNKGMLTVGQMDKKVSILIIEVKSIDELFSKALTENIIQEVSTFYISTKSKKARNNVAILQKQADSIRNELNAAISGAAQATDNTFNLNPALNIKKTGTTKRQIDVQANTVILTQLVNNLESAKMTLLNETPLIQIIDKPLLPLKKEQTGVVKYSSLIAILFCLLISSVLIIGMEIKSLLK